MVQKFRLLERCPSDARAMLERCSNDTRKIGNHPIGAPQNGRFQPPPNGCLSDARATPERCPSDTREIGNHPTGALQNGRFQPPPNGCLSDARAMLERYLLGFLASLVSFLTENFQWNFWSGRLAEAPCKFRAFGLRNSCFYFSPQ